MEIAQFNIQRKFIVNIFKNNKILVSNGKSLVIKTISSFYRYPLKKTPLNLILDKNFLIDKINDLSEEKLSTTYINFKILENDNEFNIFFDNETFNLIGWQTKDIYQNINVTYLSSIEVNQQVDKDLFKLPIQN
jgi:outer membrane lipoprotein-sorting protein